MIRLEYLKLLRNPQLGDLELFLSEENELGNIAIPYTSVLIGPNGTGKSYILRTIIDLFREIFELKINGKRRKYVVGGYLLKYYMNGYHYSFGNIQKLQEKEKNYYSDGVDASLKGWKELGNKTFFEKNGEVAYAADVELPDSLLASSIMLTDKFVFLSNPSDFPQYKYLGIRTSRSTAGTRSYIKNTINLLANSTQKGVFAHRLPSILHFLNLEPYMILSYSVKRKDVFFTGEINKETFRKFIEEYELGLDNRRKKESKNIIPWYAFQHYKHLMEDGRLLDSLIYFCNKKAKMLKRNDSSGNLYFEYDLIKDLITLESEISSINSLEKLNLIGYPELCFKKEDNIPYNFEGASSGEAHFLSSIIGILATLKENSLVFIDEPEISLHPNWQMKYLTFLREVFSGHSTCHLIIATHSHFLVSDMNGESSDIIALKRNGGDIEVVKLPKNLNTYGWSTEQVLLDVFDLPTTRNFYIANRISVVLKKAATGDLKNLNKYKDELLKYRNGLKEEDPLHYTITKIAERLGWLD